MTRAFAAVLVALVVPSAVGCGGKGAVTPGQAAKPAVDADPYALLPPAALVVARVDAGAVYANPTIGPELAAMTDALLPLGEEVGFHPSRDVDRLLVASYTTSRADVTAVLVGRFDVDRITGATQTRRHSPILSERHGALTAYHADGVAWAPITSRTLVAGTAEGVSLVLDRIIKGTLDRWEPGWMTTLLETPGAQATLAGDFASQPLAAAAVGAISLPWVHGIRRVQGVGVLKPDALAVTTTFSYGDAGQAQEAGGGLRRSVQMLNALGPILGGLRLGGFDMRLDAQDVRCSFALDNQTLRTLLGLAQHLTPS
jgi:hypothetical protein